MTQENSIYSQVFALVDPVLKSHRSDLLKHDLASINRENNSKTPFLYCYSSAHTYIVFLHKKHETTSVGIKYTQWVDALLNAFKSDSWLYFDGLYLHQITHAMGESIGRDYKITHFKYALNQ